jgi:hypothetical protein
MTNPKLEALSARVTSALAGLSKRTVKEIEVTEFGVRVVTSKAGQETVKNALYGACLAMATRSPTEVFVALALNTGVMLTVVEAGNEETIEVGMLAHARRLLETKKGDTATIAWRVHVESTPMTKSESYTYRDGVWCTWI